MKIELYTFSYGHIHLVVECSNDNNGVDIFRTGNPSSIHAISLY